MTFYGRKRSARFHNVQIINVRFGMYFFQKFGEVSTDKSGTASDKIIHMLKIFFRLNIDC